MLQNKSSMNLLNIVALGIGSIVGAGIFALLGQVILLSGHKAYYSFIIAGVTAMFSGYSYAAITPPAASPTIFTSPFPKNGFPAACRSSIC